MKVFIGGCVRREVDVAHMRSLMRLMARPEAQWVYAPQIGDSLLERARSINATAFLKTTDADVYLSLDSDIADFTPDDIIKLCELAMEYDIVSGSYVGRGVDKPAIMSAYPVGVSVIHGLRHEPVEITWAATGCLAVRRGVFEILASEMTLLHPSHPFAFYNFFGTFEGTDAAGEPILLSEDYAFCERARKAGFRIYVDPAVRVAHIGTYQYRLEDLLTKKLPPMPLVYTRSAPYAWDVRSLEPEELEKERELSGMATA